MNDIKVGDKLKIYCYKHDGSLEHTSDEAIVLENNDDEIMRLESICFSIQDILFILSLIQKKPKIFEELPNYTFFSKTIERIQCDEIKLNNLARKNGKNKIFYIIYKDEKN